MRFKTKVHLYSNNGAQSFHTSRMYNTKKQCLISICGHDYLITTTVMFLVKGEKPNCCPTLTLENKQQTLQR